MSERLKKLIADYEKNGWSTDFAVHFLTEFNRLKNVEAENQRLRDAAKPFVEAYHNACAHMQINPDFEIPQDDEIYTRNYCAHYTVRQLRALAEAVKESVDG